MNLDTEAIKPDELNGIVGKRTRYSKQVNQIWLVLSDFDLAVRQNPADIVPGHFISPFATIVIEQ